MRPASLRRARWIAHPDGTGAPPAMRDWLATPGSLTARLVAHSAQFRVQKLCQQPAQCLADEAHAIGLPRARRVWEREVLLRCDGKPAVFGHTVVPTSATISSSVVVVKSKVGVTRALPTSPQSGFARIADAMYARNTTMTERKTRSMVLYDALITRAQMAMAVIGTAM